MMKDYPGEREREKKEKREEEERRTASPLTGVSNSGMTRIPLILA